MSEQSELEFLSSRYADKFNEEPPEFSATLSGKNICAILRKSLRDGENLREMSEVEFLQMQYRALFGESLTYNFMTIHTEEELLTALRDSLKSGKPYELPDDVKQLIEQGANF